jgi:hypothetical protein
LTLSLAFCVQTIDKKWPENASKQGQTQLAFNPTRRISMTTRRQFMLTVVPAVAAVAALSTATSAQAQAAVHVDEKEPGAAGLGYKHDATKVDAKKYATYKAGAVCGNCQFYQGKPTDAWGACPLLGGKQANAKGWCSGYAKKA